MNKQSQESQLSLIGAVTSPATVLTYNNMVATLLSLELVKNPNLVAALKLLQSQMPANTPATLGSFLSLTSSLVKIHPEHTPNHFAKVDALIETLASSGNPDPPLTWALFFPILQQLIGQLGSKGSKAPKHK